MKYIKEFFSIQTIKNDFKRYCDYYLSVFGELLLKVLLLSFISIVLFIFFKEFSVAISSDNANFFSLKYNENLPSGESSNLYFLFLLSGLLLTPLTFLIIFNNIKWKSDGLIYRKLSLEQKSPMKKIIIIHTIAYLIIGGLVLLNYLYLWLSLLLVFPIAVSAPIYITILCVMLESPIKYRYLKFKRKYCKVIIKKSGL